jgi:HEPN domain-containing protein
VDCRQKSWRKGRSAGIVSGVMRRDTENWMESAAYDMKTARNMLKTGRYLYVVFMCHLALEKMLKAYLTESTQALPVRTHDLLFLISKSDLTLKTGHLDFIGQINNASIPTR